MAAAAGELSCNGANQHTNLVIKRVDSHEVLPSASAVIDVESLVSSAQVRTTDADPAKETHYVLIIHGTFSRPKIKGRVNWFHPDPKPGADNFCGRLALLLSGGHFGAEAVWRTLPSPELLPSGVQYPFYWDGSNTDEGRKEGAWHLAKLIRHIANNDPSARVHLIAHSHGGNVALKAIEQYIHKLEQQSAQEDWPDVVQERFRMAHEGQSDEIGRWRKVEDVPWWKRGVPLLIVWRGRKGETKSEELYPWGYHRCVDALFKLGRRRKALYLRNRRMTSPVSNALGKVVFLGTPFYCKHWVSWVVPKILFSFLISLVLGFVLTWVAVGIWAGVLGYDTSRDVVAYVAAGLTLLLCCADLIGFVERTMFRSGNMYHSDKVPWSPAQHALVIQAGKLDEAALALSAEPAARAFLLPLVRRATARAGFVGLPRRPGERARAHVRAFYCLAVFRAVVLNLVLLFPRILVWLVSKIVVVNTFNTIRQVVMGLAYGLDTANLKNARVFVEETLELGGKRNIRTWDVRRLLAQAEERGLERTWVEGLQRESLTGINGQNAEETNAMVEGAVSGGGQNVGRRLFDSPNGSADESFNGRNGTADDVGATKFRKDDGTIAGTGVDERVSSSAGSYSFLWDDAELLARSDSSLMYNKLRRQLPRIDHNPRLLRAQFARELRCLCCVVEARFWEMRSQWQLTHATYYRNQEIVEAVVAFLESLEVPAG